jgi:hypothetical protein
MTEWAWSKKQVPERFRSGTRETALTPSTPL